MRTHIKKVRGGDAALPPPLPLAAAGLNPPICPPSACPHPLQLEDMRKNEDPRLSFSTPEFKEAQRQFTDAFKVRGGPPEGVVSSLQQWEGR